MKKRIFGIILCASLLLSSMNVFAGSAIKWFDKNIAHLEAKDGVATAITEAYEAGIIKTQVRAYGPYEDSGWFYGGSIINCATPIGCTGADSYHYVGSNSAFLTVLY